jgi:hypothetical protein
VVRPGQRLLERPPAERYAAAEAPPGPTGSVARALAGAAVPAVVGAALLVLLASPLAVVEPLVVVAVLLGLATGVGTRFGAGTSVGASGRHRIATVVAVAAVAITEVIVWQLALAQGGVLPFVDFQWQVFGPIALLQPFAAGLAALASA